MAKPVRNTRMADEPGGVWLQPSGAIDDAATGFSERDSGYVPPSEEPEQRRLTRAQQALRKQLKSVSTIDAVEAGGFSAGDGIEVAIDSLRRSSAMVEEMIGHSAKTGRQFDLRSRRLDEQLRRNGELLAALLGDER